MATNPLRISAKVTIDAAEAKKGASEANSAVASIGTTAQDAKTKLEDLGRAAQEGIRNPLAGAGGSGSGSGLGADFDKIRARFNPLFSVITQYKTVLGEIRQAHAIGAISSDEMTSAIQRHRQAALADIDAIKGRTSALSQVRAEAANSNNQRFQTSNLAFQMQDVFSTAAFMPWYTVALQQGPQVASIMDTLDDKAAGLKAAFLGLVSPWSLISVAAVGATAFAVQYFSDVLSGSSDASAKLTEQAELIQALAEKWGEAIPALRDYANEVQRAKDTADIKQSAALVNEKTLANLKAQLAESRASVADLVLDLRAAGEESDIITRLEAAFRQFSKAADEGKVSTDEVKSVQDALADAINSTGIPSIANFANIFNLLSASALTAASSVEKVNDAASRNIPVTAWRSYNASTGKLETNAQPGDDNIKYGDGFSGSITPEVGPVPESRPKIELEGLPGQMKAAESAAKSAANAYRDLIKSANDRISQMQLEANTAGLTGIAADTLRFKQQLLQDAQDKGRTITPAQRAEIEKLGDAYEAAATKAAKLQLQSNLLFDREQLGRSTFDQQIASGLRSAGLAIDFDSYEAGLIRTNLQLQYTRDLTGEVTSSFWSSLDQGASLWEAFGDAGMSALKKIADTMMNDLLNSIFAVNSASSSSGGGLLGTLFSGIGSLFGGSSSSASSFSWASSGDFDYDGGGYTGPGGIKEPAGVVHKGEVVWSQSDVARAGGVATVEAMRLGKAGYDNGGTVGVTPLFSAAQNAAVSGGAIGGTVKLAIQLSSSVDETGNMMPFVKKVIAQDAPGIAAQVVDDFSQNVLPDRQAEIQENPRWRG